MLDPAIHATSECLDIAAEAKTILVDVDGIGSELHPTLFAWHNHQLLGYAMLDNINLGALLTYTRLTQAAGLLVTGWHATALALVMEGYAQPDTAFIAPRDGHNLAQRFPTDPTIVEALWVAYTQQPNNQRCLGLRPYHIGIGRTVTYDQTTYDTRNPEAIGDYNTPGTFPYLIDQALLTLEPTPIPPGATLNGCRQVIAGIIHRLGFSVRLDDPQHPTHYPDPITKRKRPNN